MNPLLRRICLGFAAGLLALAPLFPVRSAGETASEAVGLSARAQVALLQILAEKTSWEQMHASEALIVCGDGEAVHQRFLPGADRAEAPFRTSIWRMLAWSATDPAERNRWIARIEAVALMPAATDRFTAVEILCKFHHRLRGPALAQVQGMSRDPVQAHALFGWWALAVADDPAALPKITEALASGDSAARGQAGSILRWLRPDDASTRERLARAADREAPGSPAFTSVVGAAVILNADPSHETQWRAELEDVVRQGPGRPRWAACQALMLGYTPADLAKVTRFLDAPDPDSRTGAAWVILHVLGRPRA